MLFNGNTASASSLYDKCPRNFADQVNCVVHAIEMPGVRGSNSKGNLDNQSHLIKAGILQVEYLISQGVDPEKISLYGVSLGAAVATITAAHFHDHGKKISVWNDRSFSSLSSAANGMFVNPLFKWVVTPSTVAYSLYALYKDSFDWRYVAIPIAAYVAVNTIVKIALRASNWEMNAGDAYLSLPKYYKMLSYTKDDDVLGNMAGLYQVLRSAKQRFDDMITYMNGGSRILGTSLDADRAHGYTFYGSDEEGGCGFGSGDHNGDMQDMKRGDANIQSDFIHFVKEVQVRNEIKDFVIEMCAKVEDVILSGKKFELEDKDLPDLLKQHKASVNAALTNAQKDVKKLIEEYKAEQDRGAFTKGLRVVYNGLRNAIRKIISFVYNLHEAKGQDKYLYSTQDLADKIV